MAGNPNPRDERTWDGDGGEAQRKGNSRRSDADLVSAMIQRDPSSCAELYDRYARMVFAVALRVTSDRAAAEDVVHDLFLQLWRNPESFNAARGNLPPWLAVIARNRAIDHLRRQKKTIEPQEVMLPSEITAADEVERAQMVEKVREALAAIPAEQRNTLELAFFKGLTHSDIASQTGAPLGTVKTRIRSALTAIRKALQR